MADIPAVHQIDCAWKKAALEQTKTVPEEQKLIPVTDQSKPNCQYTPEEGNGGDEYPWPDYFPKKIYRNWPNRHIRDEEQKNDQGISISNKIQVAAHASSRCITKAVAIQKTDAVHMRPSGRTSRRSILRLRALASWPENASMMASHAEDGGSVVFSTSKDFEPLANVSSSTVSFSVVNSI
jgi:hypothetical protein